MQSSAWRAAYPGPTIPRGSSPSVRELRWAVGSWRRAGDHHDPQRGPAGRQPHLRPLPTCRTGCRRRTRSTSGRRRRSRAPPWSRSGSAWLARWLAFSPHLRVSSARQSSATPPLEHSAGICVKRRPELCRGRAASPARARGDGGGAFEEGLNSRWPKTPARDPRGKRSLSAGAPGQREGG
jgi:hypothetical protein